MGEFERLSDAATALQREYSTLDKALNRDIRGLASKYVVRNKKKRLKILQSKINKLVAERRAYLQNLKQ